MCSRSTSDPVSSGAQDGMHVHRRTTLTTTTEEYAHGLYRGVTDDNIIQSFLKRENVYDFDSGRWLIPHAPSIDSLIGSIYGLVQRILGHFATSTRDDVSRTVGRLGGGRTSDGDGGASISPGQVLVIRARGPSFESRPPLTLRPGELAGRFSDVASCIIVKLESGMGGIEETVRDVEPYARQIFNEQPNRLFVRSLVVTEEHARLVHFDRAGIEATPLIDIHKHPETLVCLVAGLATTNERLLGLDDSIQWTVINGMKHGGTLTTTGPKGGPVTFPILEHIPVALEGIVGRGTNCWRVQDPETMEELVVKDSWRPDHLPPEHGLLELARGLPGVVQMVSYDRGRSQTNDFRCSSTVGNCYNRVAERTTMKSYGKSIDFFTSPLQVLCAIRDAIAGHQNLIGDSTRILHRDISHNNILIGEEGSPEGYRGVLIDLDIAFRGTEKRPTAPASSNFGTRMFQSLCVLDSYEVHSSHMAHDYLDDLESFFYVLVYTFLIHMPDGRRVSSKEKGPSIVGPWENSDPCIASQEKSSILAGSNGIIAKGIVERNWGPICAILFTKFRHWMSDTRQDKLELLFRPTKEDLHQGEEEWYEDDPADDAGEGQDKLNQPLATLHALRDEHYSYILGIFDDAIKEIQASGTPSPATSKPEIPGVQITPVTGNPSPCSADTSESAIALADKLSPALPSASPPYQASLNPVQSLRTELLPPKPKPRHQPAPRASVASPIEPRCTRTLKRRPERTEPSATSLPKSRHLKKAKR